jgi:hypothetical protein
MDEFDRDCILGFLVVFSFLVLVADDNKIFGESEGLEDDESDINHSYILLGMRNSVPTNNFGLKENN